MALTLDGNDYEDPETGMYDAACVGVVDLGLQQEEWDGITSEKQKIIFVFELDEENSEGKKFTLQKWLTASIAGNSNMAKMLRSWGGPAMADKSLKGFDVSTLLGRPCRITVVPKASGMGVTIGDVLPAGKKGGYEPDATPYLVDDDCDQCPPELSPKIWDRVIDGRRAANKAEAAKGKSGKMKPMADDEIPFGH